MKSLVKKLKDITISAERFEAIKNDLKRNIANARLDVAYQQLIYEMRYLSSKHLLHRDEIYNPANNIDLITGVTLKQLKKFTSGLFEEIGLEGSAYGSLNPTELKSGIEAFYETLKSDTLAKNDRPENETIQFQNGKPIAKIINSDSHNYCWGSSLQFGKRAPTLNAAIRIGHSHLKTSFFTELRTKQQLGYVVYSGLNYHEKVLGLLFLIQSSQYNPFEIAKKIQDWKKLALQELGKMTDAQFEAYKKAVAIELREKDKTMSEKHQTNIFEAIIMDGQFDYKEKIAKAVEKLGKQDVINIFKDAFSEKNEAYLSVYLTKEKNKLDLSIKESIISNSEEFKQKAKTF